MSSNGLGGPGVPHESSDDGARGQPCRSNAAMWCGVVALAAVSTMGALYGGPALGDHEALVGECAREMRLTGDWVVPRFLDTPFIRKPPLPYWLVAAASYVLPNAPRTGLPVSDAAARLPSALSGFGTVLLLFVLGSAMFGRRAGVITAAIAGSSVFVLLYSANATAEMLLTFSCTWSYVHFWFAVRTKTPKARRLHLLLCYVALGVAMLAKGPAPIALVVAPLLAWWYMDQPLRILARGGAHAVPRASRVFLRGFVRRTARLFSRLGVVPGVLLTMVLFVPWMLAVADRVAHAWSMWDWQYVQRSQGNFEDTRVRGALYYLPILAGLTIPWVPFIVEGVAAPWLRRHARRRRALLFAEMWAVVGVLAMSLMSFKKPYYVLPAVPGLILLLAVAVERHVSSFPKNRARAWGVWWVGAVIGAGAFFAASAWAYRSFPEVGLRMTVMIALFFGGVLAAAAAHVCGRGLGAVGILAGTTIVVFHAVWYGCGAALENVDQVKALAETLVRLDPPDHKQVVWASGRPDARLSFYYDRRSRHLIRPMEIVSRFVDRTNADDRIAAMALARAREVLAAPKPVLLILDRRHYKAFRQRIESRAAIVGVVKNAKAPNHDWIIVSNASPGARAAVGRADRYDGFTDARRRRAAQAVTGG